VDHVAAETEGKPMQEAADAPKREAIEIGKRENPEEEWAFHKAEGDLIRSVSAVA
jgi:hypothetical protein